MRISFAVGWRLLGHGQGEDVDHAPEGVEHHRDHHTKEQQQEGVVQELLHEGNVAVFLLVGVTFLCAPWVQHQRGHIGIEALAGYLSPRANQWRLAIVDVASAAFCLFFSWKSWTLLHEAVVDGQTTSSSWGPPLWIPYSMMAVGMTLIGLQQVLHAVARFSALRRGGQ